MANNRIYLVCKKDNQYFALMKYYPSSGWYTQQKDNEALNNWLEQHNHEISEYGEDFYLVYETEDKVKEINISNKTIKVILSEEE